jgi:hypothetical protein
MTMISSPSRLILLIAAVAFSFLASSVHAGMASAGTPLKYQALHQMLSIGDDPNQAILTNILINMEGI